MLQNLPRFWVFLVVAGLVAGLYYIVSRRKSTAGRLGGTFLNLYTTDFTRLAQEGKIDPVIDREKEIRRLTQVLSRREKNNAILIGPPGVGKTAIVEGLAGRIVRHEVPESLYQKRVLTLDVATLMAGTKYRGEFEQRAKKIVQEIEQSQRSIILFIDEVHSVVQSQGSEGSVNLSDILKPALARGDLQMVGATTTAEYEKYIKTDLSLERRFQPIEVREPTPEETLDILRGVKDKYREFHKVEFTDAALEAAVRLSNKLIADRRLPDKALDALDEAAAMVKVAHLQPALTAVFYQTAAKANPAVADLWKKIQAIDKKIKPGPSPKEKNRLTAEREKMEAELAKLGVVTVDAGDVEQVINEWMR